MTSGDGLLRDHEHRAPRLNGDRARRHRPPGRLPEPERKAFHAGIEGLWQLYDELGAETFGRVLRFTAAAEAGGFLRAELIPDLDADLDFALG